MASLMQWALATAAAQADSVLTRLNGGRLRVYNGTRPANADTAIGAQTMLAEFTLPNPAGTQSNGVITLGTIADVTVTASGTATWFRLLTNGSATVGDGNVATSNADLVFPTVDLVSGTTIGIANGTVTIPTQP